jgi:hypothetical protein
MTRSNPALYLTLSGLPVTIRLDWPFHPEKTGSDNHVLHGDVRYEGDDLHAAVSVHASVTFSEALSSLKQDDAESAVINAMRKETDRHQLEFLKTSKLQPVPLSSRFLDLKTGKPHFYSAGESEIKDFLKRKAFWLGEKLKALPSNFGAGKVWMADPYDADYLGTTTKSLWEIAKTLQSDGLIRLDGEYATPTEKLTKQAGQLEADLKASFEKLLAKHRFEAANQAVKL